MKNSCSFFSLFNYNNLINITTIIVFSLIKLCLSQQAEKSEQTVASSSAGKTYKELELEDYVSFNH